MAESSGIAWTILAENVPEWPVMPEVPALRWEDGDDAYGPSRGTPRLLEALAERCRTQGADVGVGVESIMVTNGGFDALALISRFVRARGARRVVCAGPILASVADLFHSIGLDLVVKDWDAILDGEGWRTLGLSSTDIVYINTPHNPTGACLAEKPARALLADQSRRGFSVILDLVYDSFCFDEESATSPLAWVDDWQGVFAFNSFSKNFGAPGLRVGWLMAEPSAVEELTCRFEKERISVSSTAQLRAAALCALGNEPLVDAVRRGRGLVLDWAATRSIDVVAGHGGTQVWVDLHTGDAESLADQLMEREQVIVTTGLNYYPTHPRHVRLPTGICATRLARGLGSIDTVRRDLQMGLGVGSI
jgi:beta-methylarginine biosynthesis bifunctional aminotransferase